MVETVGSQPNYQAILRRCRIEPKMKPFIVAAAMAAFLVDALARFARAPGRGLNGS
jgi:hypothetical protein